MAIPEMDIRIGTSGYSFDDWRLTFYPTSIAKGKMLDYYQQFFRTVEINSTYYSIPHPMVMYNMVKKTKPDFDFIIKANKNLTHERRGWEQSAKAFHAALKPMADRGQLKGILAQFPWSFKYTQRNIQYLEVCNHLMAPYPFYVEFRHNSWMRPATFAALREMNIHFVSVDEPNLQGLLPPELKVISDTAYIRLHGRNAEHWWDGGTDRYDYDYNHDELREWKEKLERMKGQVTKAFIFFNNCHLGQAVKNAREMMQMFDM